MIPSDSWKPLDIDHPDAGLVPLPPSDVCVVAFLAGPRSREGGWAARAAIEIARGWGAQGARVVLCDVGVEQPELHRAAGLDNLEGISDALVFGTSFQRLSQPLSDGLFLATAGTAVPDAEAIRVHPRWRDFATGFEDAGAILALYMPWDAPGADALLTLSGAEVLLATRDEAEAAAPSPRRLLLGTVGPGVPAEAPSPESTSASEASDSAEDDVAQGTGDASGVEAETEGGPVDHPPEVSPDGDGARAGAGSAPVEEPGEPEQAHGSGPEPEADTYPVMTEGADSAEETASPRGLNGEGMAGELWIDPFAEAEEEALASFRVPEPSPGQETEEAGEPSSDEYDLEAEAIADLEVSVVGAVGPFDALLERGPLTPEGLLGDRQPHPPEEVSAEAPRKAPEDRGRKKESRSPPRSVIVAVVAVAVLVAGRMGLVPIPWIGPAEEAEEVASPPAQVPEGPAEDEVGAVPEEGSETGAEETAAPVSRDARPAPPVVTRPEPAAEPMDASSAAAFAVTLGAYANVDSATARARILNGAYPEFQFLVAPVEVNGRPYFRLIAGSAPDAASGRALRDRLTSTIPGAGDWILRDARLGYLIGARPTLGLAREQVDVLEGMGIPCHILRYADDAGVTEYRVYAGAYASEGEARYMGRLLEENNIENAVLTQRRGVRPE